MEKKVCKTCGNEIEGKKIYCNKTCYNLSLSSIIKERNKSNTGKTWEQIMGKEKTELRKSKKSKQMTENNVSKSPEVAKKISLSLSNHLKHCPRTGGKNPFYGKKHTEETKNKLSSDKKGKWAYNEDQYQKLLDNTPKKENHPNWNGGSSKFPYPFGFNNELKETIKKRDFYKCVVCQKEDEKLAIHHIDYNKQNITESNLISLCFSCHAKTNFNRQYWCDLFTNMTFCQLK